MSKACWSRGGVDWGWKAGEDGSTCEGGRRGGGVGLGGWSAPMERFGVYWLEKLDFYLQCALYCDVVSLLPLGGQSVVQTTLIFGVGCLDRSPGQYTVPDNRELEYPTPSA